MRTHRDLLVWQKGIQLAEAGYKLTANLPHEELFGLTSQIRRAAVSVPANIAEGYGRETLRSYLSFLRIARGSLRELETHLTIAERVGLLTMRDTAPAIAQCDELARMLHVLVRKLEARLP